MARFPHDKNCEEFLRLSNWNSDPICPQCKNSQNNYYLKKRDSYQCYKCRKQFHILSGTIFEGSRVPLTKWFIAIYYFTTAKRGISSVQLQKWLGVTQKTAWIMLQKLRLALEHAERTILNGVVECDEMYYVANPHKDMRLSHTKKWYDKKVKWRKEKYYKYEVKEGEKVKRGRKKNNTNKVLKNRKKLQDLHPVDAFGNERIIFGMTERGGDLVLKYISAANGTEVNSKMLWHINEEATIMTDESKIYSKTWTYFNQHMKINHSKRKFRNGEITTNSIENAFKHLRSTLRGTYCNRISDKHLQLYLEECSYRWNLRNSSEKQAFDSFFNKVPYAKTRYKDIKYVNSLAA
jgi:transposase-like protein